MTHVQTLFLQPRHGLAGDMFLGLLVDLGASITDIIRELETLNLAGWSIEQSQGLTKSVGSDPGICCCRGVRCCTSSQRDCGSD